MSTKEWMGNREYRWEGNKRVKENAGEVYIHDWWNKQMRCKNPVIINKDSLIHLREEKNKLTTRKRRNITKKMKRTRESCIIKI